jgi:hypothetical protein
MPYANPYIRKAYSHQWWLEHKLITRLRSKAWKVKRRMKQLQTLSADVITESERKKRYYELNKEYIRLRNLAAYHQRVGHKDWKPKRKEEIVTAANLTPEQEWFEKIRLNVCRGISTKTLPPEERDRWWNELRKRIINKCGTYCLERPTANKYCYTGLFANGASIGSEDE